MIQRLNQSFGVGQIFIISSFFISLHIVLGVLQETVQNYGIPLVPECLRERLIRSERGGVEGQGKARFGVQSRLVVGDRALSGVEQDFLG